MVVCIIIIVIMMTGAIIRVRIQSLSRDRVMYVRTLPRSSIIIHVNIIILRIAGNLATSGNGNKAN